MRPKRSACRALSRWRLRARPIGQSSRFLGDRRPRVDSRVHVDLIAEAHLDPVGLHVLAELREQEGAHEVGGPAAAELAHEGDVLARAGGQLVRDAESELLQDRLFVAQDRISLNAVLDRRGVHGRPVGSHAGRQDVDRRSLERQRPLVLQVEVVGVADRDARLDDHVGQPEAAPEQAGRVRALQHLRLVEGGELEKGAARNLRGVADEGRLDAAGPEGLGDALHALHRGAADLPAAFDDVAGHLGQPDDHVADDDHDDHAQDQRDEAEPPQHLAARIARAAARGSALLSGCLDHRSAVYVRPAGDLLASRAFRSLEPGQRLKTLETGPWN